MRSLKAGAVVLSLWSGLNLLVAVGVTTLTLMGRSPPALALMLTETEIAHVDHRVLAVVNAQAALVNPCIVAFLLLVLVVLWRGVMARVAWAYPALVASLLPVQAFGYVSDAFLGNTNLVANLVSTAILIVGLTLCGLGLRRSPSRDDAGFPLTHGR